MARQLQHLIRACLSLGCISVPHSLHAADATFIRAINLHGPPLTIDGRPWDGSDAPHLAIRGKTFENQNVALRPATDPARARMLRSSVWGNNVEVTLEGLAPGDHQLVLYLWEDNHSEQFDVLINDTPVLEKAHTGAGGSWKQLGPWRTTSVEGKIRVTARTPSHGAVNLSGLELWSGSGTIPGPAGAEFATHLTAEHTEFFERKIRPVLVEHCYECHSASAKKLKGGLLLDSRAGVVNGGDNGPAITPGQPEASLLIQAVRHTDPDLAMPPKRKLPDHIIADLETWVRMGAPDPRTESATAGTQAAAVIDWTKARSWWSFRPLKPPAVPGVKRQDWPASGLDRFVLDRLERENLTPAPAATKRALIRRASFDLIGLPPTPDEVATFLADDAPDAFAKVVERLLASPRYGERWGRHWLDVVRYADTAGDNSDFPIPQMHRYRDWVINAFNRDLPYDQFVRDQIAGDLLPGATPEEAQDRLIATGYIANARRFGSRVEDYPQHLTIEDTIDNLGRAFLGLSISCARCHDHKFDPITSADYYALYGFFHSTRYPWPGIELDQRQRDLVPLVEPSRRAESEAARRAHDDEKRRLGKAVQTLKDSVKDTPPAEKPALEARINAAELAFKEFTAKPLPFDLAYAVSDLPKAADVPIQMKGDPAKPGEVVRRRFLTVLGAQKLDTAEPTSGRRDLAAWIADCSNPLTARVMVNRIWLQHFGKGLVPTPNDFGRQGKPATHPELLDWLAATFIRSGWSIKSMHRLILLSRTYQLTSTPTADATGRDANNELLSLFPRRRMDAETFRDTLLTLGGNLDTSHPGPHPFPPQTDWKFTQHNPFKAVYDSHHRSVYLMTQRIQRHPYLAVFDGADPAASTPVRTSSTTPLQALFLLNDKFVHAQAQAFAARILDAAPTDAARLRSAFAAALSRPPDPAELDACGRFLADARDRLTASGTASDGVDADAWQAFVRALFRLNEFAYVD
jgi:hypothetical protein